MQVLEMTVISLNTGLYFIYRDSCYYFDQATVFMTQILSTFLKIGNSSRNPTPINYTHGTFWAPYTAYRQETFHLRSDNSNPGTGEFNDDPHAVAERVSLWNDLLPQLMEIHVNRTPLYVTPELREYTGG